MKFLISFNILATKESQQIQFITEERVCEVANVNELPAAINKIGKDIHERFQQRLDNGKTTFHPDTCFAPQLSLVVPLPDEIGLAAKESAVKELIKIYEECDDETTLLIIEALAKNGTAAAVDGLKKIYEDDEDPRIRNPVIKALGNIG